MYAALNSVDPSDPDVIIKLDISKAFNALCRQLTLDDLGGQVSSDHACGLKEGDNIVTFTILSPALLRLLLQRARRLG